MKKTVIIGQRGVVTLPFKLRARLGLKEGDALGVEEQRGGLLLRPVAGERSAQAGSAQRPEPRAAGSKQAEVPTYVEELEDRLL